MSTTEQFFRDKVVLITGASSGIGEELSWQLSQAGAKLTLAARRTELLEALVEKIAAAQPAKPLAVACDVTQDGDLERVVAESVRTRGQLDVAIANAGFGVVGPLKQI
jgi:NADP-dependent 3-hydroxy acid dehydrogenase YdfG